MQKLYSEEDVKLTNKQFYTKVAIFSVATLLFLLSYAGVLLWYSRLPYTSDKFTLVKFLGIVAIVIYVTFAVLYISLKILREGKYKRMLRDMKTGLTESATGNFIRYEEEIIEKDGVECRSFFISVYYEKKLAYFERQVLVDKEKEMPSFNVGDKIKVVTHANFLIEYEVVK